MWPDPARPPAYVQTGELSDAAREGSCPPRRSNNDRQSAEAQRPVARRYAASWPSLGDAWQLRRIAAASSFTGAGDKAFCAGADIGGDLSAPEETARLVDRALLEDEAYPKPIVAAVNGDCAGGGVELLLVDGHQAVGGACPLWPAGGQMVDLSVRRCNGEARSRSATCTPWTFCSRAAL